MRRVVTLAGWLVGSVLVVGCIATAAPDAGGDPIPAPFAPFEHLIGGWKGTGVPKANPLKGWPEKHMWAWKFAKGRPIGMTVEITGGKMLAKGQLAFDPETEKYRLDGTDPAGKPVAFEGALDPSGKFLAMDRVIGSAEGKQRLTIRLLPENKIRYVIWDDRKEPGSPRFERIAEIGLTKEGEAFAAGASVADLPKCIVTGGSATMSVSFEGKTYPLCCSGCRDEFNDNPAKYVKKALLRAQNAGKTSKASGSTGLAKDDGAFEGLVDDPKSKGEMPPKSGAYASPKPRAKPKPEAADEPDATPVPEKPKAKAKAAPSPSARAASLLRQAQALEKLGKVEAALGYYQRLVADYPDAPQAKTASARIKALSE